MEAIYEVSSSEKVRSLEEDLRKELKELQNEVEDGNFMTSSVAPKAFGSIPLPKDVDHFRRERKLAIGKSLQVREAKPLIVQSDVMYEEMSSCSQAEFTGKSIPLLLHQFFVERIEHLVQCKHMHMLRWARFCEHTKAIESLFPLYQKRLRYADKITATSISLQKYEHGHPCWLPLQLVFSGRKNITHPVIVIP